MIEKSKKTSEASDKKAEPAKPSAATTLKAGLSSAKESNKPTSGAPVGKAPEPAAAASSRSPGGAPAVARPDDEIKSSSELQEKRNRVHLPQVGVVDQLRDAFGDGQAGAPSASRAWTSKIGDILTGNSGRLRDLAGLAKPVETDTAQDPHGPAPKEDTNKPANLWEKLWGIPAPKPKEPLVQEPAPAPAPEAAPPIHRLGAKDPQSLQGDYRSPSDSQVQHNWGEESLPRTLEKPQGEGGSHLGPNPSEKVGEPTAVAPKQTSELNQAPKVADPGIVAQQSEPTSRAKTGESDGVIQKPASELNNTPKAGEPTAVAPRPELTVAPKPASELNKMPKAGEPATVAPNSDLTGAHKAGQPNAVAPKAASELTSAPKAGEPGVVAQKPELTSGPSAGDPTAGAPKLEQTAMQKAGEPNAAAPKPASELNKMPNAGEPATVVPKKPLCPAARVGAGYAGASGRTAATDLASLSSWNTMTFDRDSGQTCGRKIGSAKF